MTTASVRIDGSKVRFWSTKRDAQEAARCIGWPVCCVSAVHTRFQLGFALGMGIVTDPVGGAYLSRERFAELFIARNPNVDTSASTFSFRSCK